MQNVKILNTADLLPKDPLVLKIDGVEHVKVEPTTREMIQTLKDLEELAKATSMVEELEFVCNVIRRAFPSITQEMIDEWPAGIIGEIFSIARDGNDAQVEQKDAEGNVAPAS